MANDTVEEIAEVPKARVFLAKSGGADDVTAAGAKKQRKNTEKASEPVRKKNLARKRRYDSESDSESDDDDDTNKSGGWKSWAWMAAGAVVLRIVFGMLGSYWNMGNESPVNTNSGYLDQGQAQYQQSRGPISQQWQQNSQNQDQDYDEEEYMDDPPQNQVPMTQRQQEAMMQPIQPAGVDYTGFYNPSGLGY